MTTPRILILRASFVPPDHIDSKMGFSAASLAKAAGDLRPATPKCFRTVLPAHVLNQQPETLLLQWFIWRCRLTDENEDNAH